MAAKNYLTTNRTTGVATERTAVVTSAGVGSDGEIPALDPSGRLDPSVMPTGVAADTAAIQASEALAAGDLVNIWSSTGSARVRKADGSTAGKEAHGFVLSAVASGATATVFFEGTNAQVAGLTPGKQLLSVTTPGQAVSTQTYSSGNVAQVVGYATSATSLNFQSLSTIVLA